MVRQRVTSHESRVTIAMLVMVAACSRTPTINTGALSQEPTDRAATGPAEYDVVIRNGRVLDGMGNPWILADVAIRDGKFAKIGHVTGTRHARDRRARAVRLARLDRHDGPVGRRAAAQRARREQAAHGRDDRDRRRGRVRRFRPRASPSTSRRSSARASASTSAATSARRRRASRCSGNTARAPNAPRARSHARDHRHGDARRRDGHDDGAHLSAEQLRDDRRTGRGGEGGGEIRRHLREPHSRRRHGGRSVGPRSDRDRRARGHAGRGLSPQGRVPAGVGHADGLGARGGRGGARARRRRRGGSVRRTPPAAPDSKRRFRAGRSKAATIRCARASRSADARRGSSARSQTGSPGWWNIIEAAGGWDGVVLANARNPANAKYERQAHPAISRRRWGKEPADAAWDLVLAGQRARDGDLPHDERAGHRDGAAVSVDEHRQRRRRGAQRDGRRDRPGPPASARYGNSRARDRVAM